MIMCALWEYAYNNKKVEHIKYIAIKYIAISYNEMRSICLNYLDLCDPAEWNKDTGLVSTWSIQNEKN